MHRTTLLAPDLKQFLPSDQGLPGWPRKIAEPTILRTASSDLSEVGSGLAVAASDKEMDDELEPVRDVRQIQSFGRSLCRMALCHRRRQGVWKWRLKSTYPIVTGLTPTAGGPFFGEFGGNLYVFDAATIEQHRSQSPGGAIGRGVITYGADGAQNVAEAIGVAHPVGQRTAKIVVLGLERGSVNRDPRQWSVPQSGKVPAGVE